MTSDPPLARKLGYTDAVAIGLGSMIGAGIFGVFAPAAAVAGSGLLIGLFIAAVIAYCNATSSAQLAAQYPTSGGTYVYGRERLGHWAGFVAGWSFVIGKTASCAAMAMVFAAYVAPSGWHKPVAVGATVALVTVNYFGVTRTARLTKLIVLMVLLSLGLVVSAGAFGEPRGASGLFTGALDNGLYAILQSAGLLFFAFAGYARIATMGEEVRDPARTIPRAIVAGLSVTAALYAAVAVTALLVLGPERLADSSTPLIDVVTVAGIDGAEPIVRAGAAAAALGALLALIAGVGRTSLAMARNRDLPGWLSAVHPHHQVPHRAEIALGLVIVALVLTVDLRGVIGFSSFGVLLYYFIANLAALTQDPRERRYRVSFQVLGAVGCLILVATLPLEAIVGGVVVVATGCGVRWFRLGVRGS